MKYFYSFNCRALLFGLVLAGGPTRAQENCLLVPVPLAERLARAPWAVEAQAGAAQVERDARGHLLTRYGLTVFKVFREPKGGAPLPASVLLAGGTLGTLREEVSSAPHLRPGQQGVFFLEPDPQHAGEWRLYAGPQGLIQYDLPDHSAADPFAAYPAIETALYPALRNPAQARGYRLVRPNAALAAPVPVRRAAAALAVTGFTPAATVAGTGAVLTLTGTDFGASRGTGTVQFLNADNGGTNRVRPLDSDYLSWADTEIKVRVPSVTLEGSPAGTGTVRVVNDAGTASTSAAALVINYGIINLNLNTPATAFRPRLTNGNGTGGYTLAYAPSFQQNTTANLAARDAFERSNTQWTCTTGANRTTTTTAQTTVPTGSSVPDGINIVTFDAVPATLPAGVLAVTYSYYQGCGSGGVVATVTLPETDFVFANRSDWNFGDHPLATNEFDFESVALHELGHGIQLAHVINPAAVMHFSIRNGQSKRTLGTSDDRPGGRDEVQYSTTAGTPSCGVPPHTLLTLAGCSPLPVELVAFEARYEAGLGTRLSWATASERSSAYFAVETREAGEAAPAWAEVLRRPAAGASSTRRDYAAPDPRLLSGTRYYRLRQVDADGRTAYSPVVAVTAYEAGLALYPNPAGARLQVSGPAGPGRLTLYDLAGRPVARFALAAGAAEVDLSALPAGLYAVEWTDGLSVRRGRVQKL